MLIASTLLFSAQLLYSQNATSEDQNAREGAPAQESADGARSARTVAESPPEDTLVFGDGDDDGDGAPANTANNGGIDAFGMWDLLRMLLVLLMVIGAIYGVISLLRRRVPAESEEEDSPIRILASRTVGSTHEIHAVMIGSHVLVLGAGTDGLQLISRVEDQETIDELVLAHSTQSSTRTRGRTFGAVFSHWLGNLAVPGSAGKAAVRNGPRAAGSSGSSTDGLSFFRAQQDRLRSLR